jgi:GT2 family glycosyltransferase
MCETTTQFKPVQVVEIEIGEPLAPIAALNRHTGRRYQQAICLVRLHSHPLGMLLLDFADADELKVEECVSSIWKQLHKEINEHLHQDGLLPVIQLTANGIQSSKVPRCLEEREQLLASAPFVSVIVPTHNRPERVADCLHTLMTLHYPNYEVILVDNAPHTEAIAEVVHEHFGGHPRVRYVREAIAGVSWARNRGIQEARGEILAFTDDDVVVDPYWLLKLVQAFSCAEDVQCVTGLILPLELETQAQFWFEEYNGSRGYRGSWSFQRRIFDDKQRHKHLYRIALCGIGASMAFKADFLRSIGGFDPHLGTGGRVQSGEDIAAFFKVLMHGHQLVYEPSSVVYHVHRRDYEGLRRQLYHYGVGATAYLTKNLLDHPQLFVDFLTKVPYDLLRLHLTRPPCEKESAPTYPRELITLFRRGMIQGPLMYLWSRGSTYARRRPHTVSALKKEL